MWYHQDLLATFYNVKPGRFYLDYFAQSSYLLHITGSGKFVLSSWYGPGLSPGLGSCQVIGRRPQSSRTLIQNLLHGAGVDNTSSIRLLVTHIVSFFIAGVASTSGRLSVSKTPSSPKVVEIESDASYVPSSEDEYTDSDSIH
ncbi:hypothetical protein FBU30_007380 [Linnemannia zychae]|nr:hypothetical protein FBU30_007380 [Linnemannia zychae]